jgi:hypothetical protein
MRLVHPARLTPGEKKPADLKVRGLIHLVERWRRQPIYQ